MSSVPKPILRASSPDENAAGLTRVPVNPRRYDDRLLEPEEATSIIVSMIPSGARVLDVGCAAGALVELITNHCQADVVGVEPDPGRVAVAISRGLNVRLGTLEPSLISKIGVFDIVLFSDVLEHLPNPQAVLLLARDALKPGGSVVVSVPNVAHWSVRLEILQGHFRYQESGIMDATHLKWFTRSTATSLLESSGFRVIDYRVSLGAGLPDNVNHQPMSWLSDNNRVRLLRWGCRHWPTLFGAQHIFKAEMLTRLPCPK